jgi:hypothetical protein
MAKEINKFLNLDNLHSSFRVTDENLENYNETRGHSLADWLYNNTKLTIYAKTKLYLKLRELGLITKNPEFESVMKVRYDLELSKQLMKKMEDTLKNKKTYHPNDLTNAGPDIEAHIMGFVTGDDQNLAKSRIEERDNTIRMISKSRAIPTSIRLPKDNKSESITSTLKREPLRRINPIIDRMPLRATSLNRKTQREITENYNKSPSKKQRKGGRKSKKSRR